MIFEVENSYSFMYQGETDIRPRVRFAHVEEVRANGVLCHLSWQELNCGDRRMFNFNRMTEVEKIT